MAAKAVRLHKASLPSRERGLKLMDGVIALDVMESFPSRERGLKSQPAIPSAHQPSRSLRGSVD